MSKLVLTKQSGDYWSFILDGDASNEILNTRNDLLVVGTQCHFKTANGANIIQKQDIAPTDVTVIGASTTNPIDVHSLFAILQTEGYFDWMKGEVGSGGVNRFDLLIDTFKYTGNDGMTIIVDEAQLRLVPVPFYNVEKSTDLTDMPQDIVGSQMLVTSPDGTKYQYAPIPTPPQTFLNTIGYFIYDDLITKTTPIPFTANTSVKLTNDANGDGTDSSQAPFGIGFVWNSTDGQMDFSELSIGDTVDFRMRLDTTISANTQFQIILRTGVGSPSQVDNVIFTTISGKTNGLDSETFGISFAVSEQDFIDYPSELYLLSDGSGSITVYRFYFRIIRKNINLVDIGAEGLNLKEDKVNKKPILGNETSTTAYPSAKDVVDYFNTKGASNLQQTLLQGNTADQPILLQKDPNNYVSWFHPTYFSDGFALLLKTIVSGTTSSLNISQRNTIWDAEVDLDTAADLSTSGLHIRSNAIWMVTYYQTKIDGSFSEYTVLTENSSLLIQKRTNSLTRKARFKLDNLTSDHIYQLPDGDGILALQSYVDGKITALTTDQVAEGINPSRLYFSASRAIASPLAGLSSATGGNILASDTILQAFGKLQNQITNGLLNNISGNGVAGQIAFFNGTNSLIGDAGLIWDNTNKRLGINGTPTYALEVYGTLTGAVTDNIIRANSAAKYAGILVNATMSGGLGNAFIGFQKNGVQTWICGSDFNANGTKDFYFYDTVNNNSPIFITNTGEVRLGSAGTSGSGGAANTQKLTIKTNGNILIGTITDNGTDKLQVNGSINASSDSIINNLTIGRGGGNQINNTTLGFVSLTNNTAGATNNTAIGYVSLGSSTTGINNTAIGASSGRYLNDKSTPLTNISLSLFLGYRTSALANGDTNETVIGIDANGIGSNSVVLGNDSVTKTALKGNVGIGTINTTQKLTVIDTSNNIAMSVGGGVSNPSIVAMGTLNNGTNPFIQGYLAGFVGTQNLSLNPISGNVLIGTTTDNGVDKLQVNGTAIASGYKIPSGLSTQYLMADGSTSSGGSPSIQITPSAAINLSNCTNVNFTNYQSYMITNGKVVQVFINGEVTVTTSGTNSGFTLSLSGANANTPQVRTIGNGTAFGSGGGTAMIAQTDGTASGVIFLFRSSATGVHEFSISYTYLTV